MHKKMQVLSLAKPQSPFNIIALQRQRVILVSFLALEIFVIFLLFLVKIAFD